MKVLIVGAGGHGQVVADILLTRQASGDDLQLLGYVDDAGSVQRTVRLGLPVLAPLTAIHDIAHDALVIAVGDNRQRGDLHRRLRDRGEAFLMARHPSAVVGAETTVGEGSMVCARAVVGCGSRIGRSVILNTACTVDHHAEVEDFVHVAPGVHLGGAVFVGEGALLGIGAVVLPHVRIGAHARVGAGAVVTRDVPAGATVAGVPAGLIGAHAGGRA